MGNRTFGGSRPATLGLLLAAAVGLAAPALAAEEAPGTGRPGRDASPVAEDDRGRRRGDGCPSVSSMDPGFHPDAALPRFEEIDPGFEPLPDPAGILPDGLPGEDIDPGFFVRVPPCPATEATPRAEPGRPGG